MLCPVSLGKIGARCCADFCPRDLPLARFSELLDACVNEGPQVVSRRSTETAVLVPIAEWRRMQRATRPSLKELLLTDTARTEALVPARMRNVADFAQFEVPLLNPFEGPRKD